MKSTLKSKTAGEATAPVNTAQYIVTLTLYEHLLPFKRVGLKIPSKEFVADIEKETVRKIQNGFNGAKVELIEIPFSDHCDDIVAATARMQRAYQEATVLSTTPLITHDTNGICLHLTRLINTEGKMIGIGTRSGQKTVERQLDLTENKLRNQQIILVEDGAFTGSTLSYLLKLLEERQAKVVGIVLGILFPEAEKRLKSIFKGEIVCVSKFKKPLDWMPSHDFFPFIPNSGRVLGAKLGASNIPVYLPNGATLSVPYVQPYGLPATWAGMSFGKKDLQDFSHHCLISSMLIFQEMERLNGRPIVIGDVVHTVPVTSVPVAIGQNRYDSYDLDRRIIDVINDDMRLD